MRLVWLFVVAISLVGVVLVGASESAAPERRLSVEDYLDKCLGAWAGQMIGVMYGLPYEFKSGGEPIVDPLEPWRPERVRGALEQDDLYVEMTFLAALEKHGLNITPEQAGLAFADTEYRLWHANYYGRENVRRGIMPPLSGHPTYNRHADDIDFQIEADLFGIICPGMPQASNQLCDVFGHIMCYGDGVYGGMFVAGMYAAAYFEETDVRAVIEAGLACIPTESAYARCIRDVMRWHDEHPDDWLAAWHKIEETWQDDIDCRPGRPYNIEAKLNGAYVVMGLLYGNGDLERSMEIATRCGQDADCNPSTAAGVLGCMKGYKNLDEIFTSAIPGLSHEKFSYTDYSLDTLIPACRRMAEQVLLANGGRVEGEGDAAVLVISHQPAKAAPLEQWDPAEKAIAVQTPDAVYMERFP